MNQPLLTIDGLSISYAADGAMLRGLNDVSLTIGRARILGVVGESGSGKSTLSFAVSRLLPANACIQSGSIDFDGIDLTSADERTLRRLRGDRIAMIFQNPLSSLHPSMRIGRQMADAQSAHRSIGSRDRDRRSAEMLTLVGIADAEQNLRKYAHEFSGGMRQRIMIATALLLDPDLLIADEPTSALDVVLQAQIIDLLTGLRDRLGTAVMIVSHDLGVVESAADDVLVMYAGEVMENSDAGSIFREPLHPYTQALLAVMPGQKARGRPLPTIPGRVPSAYEQSVGCAFAGRCVMTRSVCTTRRPILSKVADRKVRCHIHDATSGWHDASPSPREVRA